MTAKNIQELRDEMLDVLKDLKTGSKVIFRSDSNKTEVELLKLAARAAGMDYLIWTPGASPLVPPEHRFGDRAWWNPLVDDGDALRLAVRLHIPVFPYAFETSTGTFGVVAKNWRNADENTRFAIVGAAAEIGKNMGGEE